MQRVVNSLTECNELREGGVGREGCNALRSHVLRYSHVLFTSHTIRELRVSKERGGYKVIREKQLEVSQNVLTQAVAARDAAAQKQKAVVQKTVRRRRLGERLSPRAEEAVVALDNSTSAAPEESNQNVEGPATLPAVLLGYMLSHRACGASDLDPSEVLFIGSEAYMDAAMVAAVDGGGWPTIWGGHMWQINAERACQHSDWGVVRVDAGPPRPPDTAAAREVSRPAPATEAPRPSGSEVLLSQELSRLFVQPGRSVATTAWNRAFQTMQRATEVLTRAAVELPEKALLPSRVRIPKDIVPDNFASRPEERRELTYEVAWRPVLSQSTNMSPDNTEQAEPHISGFPNELSPVFTSNCVADLYLLPPNFRLYMHRQQCAWIDFSKPPPECVGHCLNCRDTTILFENWSHTGLGERRFRPSSVGGGGPDEGAKAPDRTKTPDGAESTGATHAGNGFSSSPWDWLRIPRKRTVDLTKNLRKFSWGNKDWTQIQIRSRNFIPLPFYATPPSSHKGDTIYIRREYVRVMRVSSVVEINSTTD